MNGEAVSGTPKCYQWEMRHKRNDALEQQERLKIFLSYKNLGGE
jgi:hypothetical protein